jgi:hypothetical protein
MRGIAVLGGRRLGVFFAPFVAGDIEVLEAADTAAGQGRNFDGVTS